MADKKMNEFDLAAANQTDINKVYVEGNSGAQKRAKIEDLASVVGKLNGIGDKHVKVALVPGESYDTKFASGLVSIRTGMSGALALFYFGSHTDTTVVDLDNANTTVFGHDGTAYCQVYKPNGNGNIIIKNNYTGNMVVFIDFL